MYLMLQTLIVFWQVGMILRISASFADLSHHCKSATICIPTSLCPLTMRPLPAGPVCPRLSLLPHPLGFLLLYALLIFLRMRLLLLVVLVTVLLLDGTVIFCAASARMLAVICRWHAVKGKIAIYVWNAAIRCAGVEATASTEDSFWCSGCDGSQ